jgi:hypothetical protein
MSTTTNFKRIALVAVAALGLGVLSSVPSQAAVNGLTVTVGNGSATTVSSTAIKDSGTAGSISVTYLKTQTYDSATVALVLKSSPAGAATIVPTLMFDTFSATSAGVPTTLVSASNAATNVAQYETTTGTFVIRDTTTNSVSKYQTASFKVILDTAGPVALTAGTYVVTAIVTPYDGSGLTSTANATNTVVKDISFTITAPTSLSKVADAATSTAVMNAGSSYLASATDSTIAVVSTAGTAAAYVRVTLKNTSSNAAQESITATIDKGNITSGSSTGKNLLLVQDAAGITNLTIAADGTAGTATLTIKSTSVTFANKTITFFSDTAAKITAGAYTSVIGSSSTAAIYATEEDSLANKFNEATEVYAYSSDTSVVSNYGTLCATYVASAKVVLCNLTGVKNGTANITLRDAATVAASTISSNVVAMTVNVNPVASYKITTDATSYAPGAKGTFLVKLYDKDGKVLPAGTYSNIFASGGITTNFTLGAYVANESITATGWTTASNPIASTAKPYVTLDPVAMITYYMPTTPGTLVLTSTGGAGVPAAAQVASTVNVSVTDSGAAALAAVTALATTVASLKTLIVTLTNLVLKIQRKVKA